MIPTASRRIDRREVIALIAIVVIGLALKAAVIGAFHHVPESDELAYESMALNLVHGRGIVDMAGNRAMYNVGYPLFVLAPMFSLFGDGLLSVRVFNAALGAIAIAMTYWLAKEAGADRIGRLAAAAAWALYLPASVYVVYLNKESLLTPLMLGLVIAALRVMRLPSVATTALLGILFGLIALTGNAGLSLAAAVGLALFLAPATWPRKAGLAMLIVVIAALVTAPWMIRNARLLGTPVLNTNGGFNLYLGNNPAATGAFISIGDTPRGESWAELRKLGEVRASDVLRQEAVTWIKDHPSEFVLLAASKVVQFWSPPVHDGKEKASTAEAAIRMLWALEFLVFVVLALASLAVSGLRTRATTVLWVAVAGYTSVHMLFYVSTRYREPIIPFVCVLAALAFERFLRLASTRFPGPLPLASSHPDRS